jgi:hypothetical protein
MIVLKSDINLYRGQWEIAATVCRHVRLVREAARVHDACDHRTKVLGKKKIKMTHTWKMQKSQYSDWSYFEWYSHSVVSIKSFLRLKLIFKYKSC